VAVEVECKLLMEGLPSCGVPPEGSGRRQPDVDDPRTEAGPLRARAPKTFERDGRSTAGPSKIRDDGREARNSTTDDATSCVVLE
jgi:hypothetical protein